MAGGFFDKHFVRWSSRDSIAAGKISLLAVAEVIFSVAAYWGIAWYFDTYAHLLISVLVAPLVLLRSDESVALGVETFSRYWNIEEIPLRSTKGVSRVILSAVISGGIGWLAADWFLVEDEGWSLFWRSALTGIFAYNVGLAGMAVLSIRGTGAASGVAALAALATAVAGVGVGAGTVAAWGVVTGEVGYLIMVAVGMATKSTSIAGAILSPGIGAGILLQAVAIRLFASSRHILKGAVALPKNWWRTLFQIDLRSAPKLIPRIGDEVPNVSFELKFEAFLSSTDILERTFHILSTSIFFVPSLLYRYSIKSTCWLYLPLIYLAHLPGRLRDGEGRLVWVRALPAKFIEGIRFGLAVLTLGIAFFALIDAAALHALLTAAGAGETPVTIFSLLVVLDFGDIRPWHYFTLPSAALTILLVLWLDSIRKDEAAGATIDALGWKITTAIFADRVRSLLVYIWLALALYYFAEYAYDRCGLPGWMTPWLEWRFGTPACAAPDDTLRRYLGVV